MEGYKNAGIIGGGNIGLSIANGLLNSKLFPAENIYITRKHIEYLDEYKANGFKITADNIEAVKNSDIIVIAVQPKQLDELLNEIKNEITQNHIIISVVSGASIKAIKELLEKKCIHCSSNAEYSNCNTRINDMFSF